jgi:NADH-quinone oxidoreductase subunit M
MIDLSGLPILTLITFAPLVGALVIAFLPRERLNWIRWAALGTALVAWALSLLLLAAFDPGASGFQFGEVADWVPAFGIQYKLGVDGISLALVVLTTTLTWISILASFGPIKERVKEYMISFLILEVGMTGVFLGLDMFLFYIFWELTPRSSSSSTPSSARC